MQWIGGGIVALLVFSLLPKAFLALKIWRWKKKLKLRRHTKVFQKLYHATNGFELSKEARRQGDALEYLYGEIEFISFIALLSLVHPQKETVFYDLGSGVGKAVLACTMVFEVKHCFGVELFQSLHDTAQNRLQALKNLSNYQEKSKKITFIQGDFLKVDFSNATLIFINATACIGPTWEKLQKKLAALKSETLIVTTSKPLALKAFFVIHETRVQMSWGSVKAYIQKKR